MASDAQWKIRGRKSNAGVAVSSTNTASPLAKGAGSATADQWTSGKWVGREEIFVVSS